MLQFFMGFLGDKGPVLLEDCFLEDLNLLLDLGIFLLIFLCCNVHLGFGLPDLLQGLLSLVLCFILSRLAWMNLVREWLVTCRSLLGLGFRGLLGQEVHQVSVANAAGAVRRVRCCKSFGLDVL